MCSKLFDFDQRYREKFLGAEESKETPLHSMNLESWTTRVWQAGPIVQSLGLNRPLAISIAFCAGVQRARPSGRSWRGERESL
jgi:hypothetical protein